MIVFENIKWKNFLSTGDQWSEINFTDSSSTLIIGANGAGKSTVLDALCFALFNKPFRKIKRSQLVNSINEKSTKVQLEFTIGKDEYRVFRGIKPNVFELYHNNKLIDQDAAVKDTQKYLEQTILKLNFKSFTQVVILGSSTFVPFMQLTAPNRREVIEDLLDINIFSHMNQLLKDRVRTSLSENNECEHSLRLAEEKVSSQEKLIGSLKQVNETRQEEKRTKIKSNQDQIDHNEKEKEIQDKELDLLEKDIVSTVDFDDKISKLRQDQADVNSELKITAKNLKFFKSHDECPTCTQKLPAKLKKKNVESAEGKVDKMTSGLDDITVKINDCFHTIKKQKEICDKITTVQTEILGHQRETESLLIKSKKILTDTEAEAPDVKKEKTKLTDFVKNQKKSESFSPKCFENKYRFRTKNLWF